MPPQHTPPALFIDTFPRDTENAGGNESCTALNSEFLTGVIILSISAFALLAGLCQTLKRNHAEMIRRDAAEKKITEVTEHFEAIVADQKTTIALYVSQWGPLPQNIINEEARNPGRHTDPGVRVGAGAPPRQTRVQWNDQRGENDRNSGRVEAGPYMSGANGGATGDRFLPQEPQPLDNAGLRAVTDESDLFVIGSDEDEDSPGEGPSSRQKGKQRGELPRVDDRSHYPGPAVAGITAESLSDNTRPPRSLTRKPGTSRFVEHS